MTRINKAKEAIKQVGLDGLALIAGPDLFYLCGLQFHLSERPVILLITPDHLPILIHPQLEAQKVKATTTPLDAFPYAEDRSSWTRTIQEAAKNFQLKGKNIGVNPTSMRFLEMDLLHQAGFDCNFVSAAQVIKDLRIIKDDAELSAMRKAVLIAEEALMSTIPQISVGKSEKEIANSLTINLLKSGSDNDLPFMPVVASGPNSANPHAVPTDRVLQANDLLVIDWGARADGYISDITRTFAIQNISDDFLSIAETVKQANLSSQTRVKPNITSHEIDFAAREVITHAGYGQYFIHRTGHGIGLETHEEPYIQEGNSFLIEEGMTFTIEPGIYLPGIGGIRIEDNVYVNTMGVETLTSLPREVRIIK